MGRVVIRGRNELESSWLYRIIRALFVSGHGGERLKQEFCDGYRNSVRVGREGVTLNQKQWGGGGVCVVTNDCSTLLAGRAV